MIEAYIGMQLLEHFNIPFLMNKVAISHPETVIDYLTFLDQLANKDLALLRDFMTWVNSIIEQELKTMGSCEEVFNSFKQKNYTKKEIF